MITIPKTRSEAVKDGWVNSYQIAFSEMFLRVLDLLNQDKFEEAKQLADKLHNDPLYWFTKGDVGIAFGEET